MNWGRLAVENHRGVRVPRMLAAPLLLAVATGTLIAAFGAGSGRPAGIVLAASALVGAAGLVDDLAGPGPRGIREHLRALGRLELSTGIVKVLVIVGAAVAVVAALPSRPFGAAAAGVVTAAACANLWNGLDVVPARALKWFLIVSVPVVAAGFASAAGWSSAPAVPAVALAAAVVLFPDLRERAMLGDAGANLIGFEIGVGLCVVLPDASLVAAAVLAVVGNAAAETFTLSRVIDSIPPLRWFDRLGRLPATVPDGTLPGKTAE